MFTPIIIFYCRLFAAKMKRTDQRVFRWMKIREILVSAWILFLRPANHTVSPQEKNKTKSLYISFQTDG